MCLLTNAGMKPVVASHDIPVYKYLTNDDKAPYYPEYTYNKGMNYPEGNDVLFGFPNEPLYKVGEGWLHSYVASHVTFKMTGALMLGKNHKLVKMYIPKGTTYYPGLCLDFCSKCLEWREGDDLADIRDGRGTA